MSDDYTLRVPPELLARIFQFAQRLEAPPDAADDSDSDEPSGNLPLEILVSHVSSYWRQTALGTALLWRNISISQTGSLAKLHAYLARSGPQTPLHFQVDLTQRQLGDVCAQELATMREKLDLVFERRERWQRLTIRADQERAELPLVGRLYDCPAPALERLVLCVEDIDRDSLTQAQVRREETQQILMQGTPQLKSLRLRGLSTHFFRPSLTTVTTLYIEQTRGLLLGFERFRELLQSAPQLAHLSVHDTIIDDEEEEWPFDVLSSIPTPQLTCLRLALLGTAQPLESGILLAVQAPLLTSLVVKNPTLDGLAPFSLFPSANTKFPALRSLALVDFDYNSADRLRPLAEALPNIVEFTRLHTTLETPAVLDMLAGNWISVALRKRYIGEGVELWPALHTVNTTMDRVGCPLRVVRLPPSVFEEAEDDEDDAETIRWLRENLEVLASFVQMERWPPGEEHDPEDNLFT
ncbi:F-box domain-containing protein [Mycena kentingensis (nom. inval.)]|nr:F-box domain-containing protein [Mycena kentingensis (nom. inval.)]